MASFLKNQKGQAIFEMVIFLPFLIFLYSIYYTVGNSINGSINQQKAVRGYFYSLLQGNSYINSYADLQEFAKDGIKQVGFAAVGWREKLGTKENSFAPCFKFSSFFKNDSNEGCDDSFRDSDSKSGNTKSRFIRLFTFYGICGPVYYDAENEFFEIRFNSQNNIGLCSLDIN